MVGFALFTGLIAAGALIAVVPASELREQYPQPLRELTSESDVNPHTQTRTARRSLP